MNKIVIIVLTTSNKIKDGRRNKKETFKNLLNDVHTIVNQATKGLNGHFIYN